MVAAMQIIHRAKFKTVPWKNGGGITHEVAKAEEDGRLLWRLSLAEVASDGPFSLFPGLARILTVIDGDGMDLRDATGHIVHPVPLLQPVAFSGDEPLSGTLRNGPCLDFNLIYDPARFRGIVRVLSGTVNDHGDLTGGLLCLNGSIRCAGAELHRQDFAFVEDGDSVYFTADSRAIHVRLHGHGAAQ
jgi:environmental stress-induced protein Ves